MVGKRQNNKVVVKKVKKMEVMKRYSIMKRQLVITATSVLRYWPIKVFQTMYQLEHQINFESITARPTKKIKVCKICRTWVIKLWEENKK